MTILFGLGALAAAATLSQREPWDLTGADFGIVFHGGRRKITSIDPAKLQARDAGFYGEGFYVSTVPQYAKTYGPVLSRFRFSPEARILGSALRPEEAPLGLVAAVKRTLYDAALPGARTRGRAGDLREEIDLITDNPLAWKNAVDWFAVLQGYDAVRHSPGEIVVKNVVVLQPVRSR